MLSIKKPNYRPLTNTILTFDIIQIAVYISLAVITWFVTTFLASGSMGDLIYVLILQLLYVLSIIVTLLLVVMNLVTATKEADPRGKNVLYAMSLLFLLALCVPYLLSF
jgi:hypothetical protein